MGLFVGSVLFSLLLCVLVSSIGVFVSLHAPTARIAYQRMSIGMLVLFIVPVILVQVSPKNNLAVLFPLLTTINLTTAGLIYGAALLAADIILILAALSRFQRARLILD
jgi:ABC-2 type transport system permease protein